jgi:hypothetical protein
MQHGSLRKVRGRLQWTTPGYRRAQNPTRSERSERRRRPESKGRPQPERQVLVVRPAHAQPVRVGEPGRVAPVHSSRPLPASAARLKKESTEVFHEFRRG